MKNPFFNAHHSPIGAFATFTLGQKGASGGLGLELGKPAEQNIYIGLEERPDEYTFLPFYKGAEDAVRSDEVAANVGDEPNDSARFVVGGGEIHDPALRRVRLRSFPPDEIARDYRLSTDRWTAGPLTVEIFSPAMPVPDPESDDLDQAELAKAILPAVFVAITLDNSASDHARRAVFGYEASEIEQAREAVRRLDDTAGGRFVGIGHGRSTAIACKDGGVVSGQGFTMSDVLGQRVPENLTFALGKAAALICDVPAGQTKTFHFAVCFYHGGIVTAGLDTSYCYTRFWKNVEDVAAFALDRVEEFIALARVADAHVDRSALSNDQKFMLVHAVRSYYGSTQMLQNEKGKPIWIVNEGEYRMMNTLDLTADQVFFEMAMNPWTVRNELDFFAERYSYTDQVYFPSEPGALYEGGISFTHDMGVANVFSRPRYSAYEKYGLSGCFSHMTHEELVNWLCCALVYGVGDPKWLADKADLLVACFQSLLNRDDPDPAKRNGIMSLESSRCKGGAEITTYDSLDASLGQSRGNVYMASKCWAAYLGLQRAFNELGRMDLACRAYEQAVKCENTICASVGSDGVLPAVIGEDVDAQIIPAIEGLAFLPFMGCGDAAAIDGPHGEYLSILQTQLRAVLSKGVCLFENGGWKLSSTSDNTWLSKVYLCQFVARNILRLDDDAITANADAAHAGWLLDPRNTYWCWSDQIVAGHAEGSRYYPRGVTAWLWITN